MNENIIRIFFTDRISKINERAKFIVEKQAKIGEALDKMEWLTLDGTVVDLNDKIYVEQLFLRGIKKMIRRHTTMVDIPDDYTDLISTIDGYYASKKRSYSSSFVYSIGMEKKYLSYLHVKNFQDIIDLHDFSSLKKFILTLIDIFKPYSIDLSEYKFYRGIMDLSPDEPWCGPIIYFSKDIKLPNLPNDIVIETLSDGGKLILTSNEFKSVDDAEYLKKLKYLVKFFRRHKVKIC